MSVINQMLKDLDKRQEHTHSGMQNNVPQAPLKNKTPIAILITVIVTLSLVALLYLFFENQSLKQNNDKLFSPQPKLVHKESHLPAESKAIVSAPIEEFIGNSQTVLSRQVTENPEVKLDTENEKSSFKENIVNTDLLKDSNSQTNANGEVQHTVKKATLLAEPVKPSDSIEQMSKLPEPSSNVLDITPSLNISRKTLSPTELATKKMAQAEQAMLDQNIKEAEQYFEEILLIRPQHEAARKQLAALLYGRNEVKQAVNILAQGVQLSPENREFRTMQARIYLDKGFQQEALTTLKPLSTALDVEYQSLLATVAQSLKEYETAKAAYTQLIKIQANQGRWHLGLAISHDSLGEFQEAYKAYSSAINAYGLSDSALSFAKQRKLELGDK